MLEGAGGRHNRVGRSERVSHDLLDLAEDVGAEVDLEMAKVAIEVVLVVAERQLVALLIPPILIRLLLHRVVSQVNQLVAQIVIDEVTRRGAQVSVVVDVPFELVVGEGEHAEAADVKLALVVKGGPLDVLLHDEGLLAVVVALAQDALDFAQGAADRDSLALIRILTRLDNPNIAWRYFFLIFLCVFLTCVSLVCHRPLQTLLRDAMRYFLAQGHRLGWAGNIFTVLACRVSATVAYGYVQFTRACIYFWRRGLRIGA
mmetsp:Transcript_28685/g.38246  ORF Transcript_28685/g.38246 Transcript_28685/m.38246 type:complete len:259 (+) Transcript_28685:746-1522(+)